MPSNGIPSCSRLYVVLGALTMHSALGASVDVADGAAV